MSGRSAERHLVRLRPLEEQVGRVLPRHADAAVQLDALLRRPDRHVGAVGLRDRARDGGVRAALGGARCGVPRGRSCSFDVAEEVGETVLEGLEAADDPPELAAHLEVGDGLVEAPLRDADLLGGEQRRTQAEGVRDDPVGAKGAALDILYTGRLCIHSRHCVLEAPQVFLANTPGEWIFPDRSSVEDLVHVAHSCPSGAIRYRRHDAGPEESPPHVNTIRVRENGPLAVNAAIELKGAAGFRATLCRCGKSANKPFCDGSHVAAGFSASGEPATVSADPLPQRGGKLEIRPQKNGPLLVAGNLELCAGTGRTVLRTAQTRLCRCGNSNNKPFCDGSHARVGFTADGE